MKWWTELTIMGSKRTMSEFYDGKYKTVVYVRPVSLEFSYWNRRHRKNIKVDFSKFMNEIIKYLTEAGLGLRIRRDLWFLFLLPNPK